MTEKSPGARLKALIHAPEILILHAVYDGFTVRLIEKYGYQAGFLSGAALSESMLGKPDVGLMGMEENLTACRRLAAACNLTLLADGDTGYGNAVNVYHMIQKFEQAGVGGIMIEDQSWPKRCGHMQGKSVVSAEEMVEKVRAAVAARKDQDFVIKARTDAFGTHGLDEAIRRLNLYAEAGADLLLADALATEEDIKTVVANVSKPLCVNMGFAIRKRSTTALISAKRLQDLGVSVVMFGRMLSASALQGLKNSLEALAAQRDSDEVVERPDLLVSFEELNDLMGLKAINQLEKQFATAK
ncbi:isocitrate lyase/PEP mutase family protein [Pigmentiphaga soli]|uniref:Isocitrate lyase/PEP mutase family protein n=1 Tax=Pigmentiphaga soli TaxID=1007095 RepID=A0ABP8H592_9BURK